MSVVSEYLDKMIGIIRSNYNLSLRTEYDTVWFNKITFLISLFTEFV